MKQNTTLSYVNFHLSSLNFFKSFRHVARRLDDLPVASRGRLYHVRGPRIIVVIVMVDFCSARTARTSGVRH